MKSVKLETNQTNNERKANTKSEGNLRKSVNKCLNEDSLKDKANDVSLIFIKSSILIFFSARNFLSCKHIYEFVCQYRR